MESSEFTKINPGARHPAVGGCGGGKLGGRARGELEGGWRSGRGVSTGGTWVVPRWEGAPGSVLGEGVVALGGPGGREALSRGGPAVLGALGPGAQLGEGHDWEAGGTP